MSVDYIKGFTSVSEEVTNRPLSWEIRTSAKFPDWLKGRLLRNGPGLFDVEAYKFRHMFDGMALLNKFEFENDKLIYTNRFLRSNAYQKAIKNGALAYREFATEPIQPLLIRLLDLLLNRLTDNNAVNIINVAGNYLAVSETTNQVEFEIETLATKGHFSYDDNLRCTTTSAHPHYDFQNNTLVSYCTDFLFNKGYTIFTVQNGSRSRTPLCTVKAKAPAYIHTFCLTENYVILIEPPLVLDKPFNLLLRYRRPILDDYDWKAGTGTTFYVISRKTGKIERTYQTEDFMGWHTVNAYEAGNDILVDISSYTDYKLTDYLFFDQLMRGGNTNIPTAHLYRYQLPVGSSTVKSWKVSDEYYDFPRINYQNFNGRQYKYAYGSGPDREGPPAWASQLLKINVDTSATNIWREPNCYPGEPVFVPRPGAIAEDDGVVLVLIVDSKKNCSSLLMLDGQSFEEIARADLPFLVPFGFHGVYYEGNF